MEEARERRPLLETDGSAPALIAHAAGNTVVLARSAIGAAADFLEVDLWVHRGRFEARHERRAVFPLPVLFEKWYLRWAPRKPFGLAELLQEVEGRAAIFLDLKNGGSTAAQLVRRSISQAIDPPRVVASSQQWSALRTLATLAPEVDLFYSIDVHSKLDLFLSVSQRDLRPRGVSCRHTLLSPGLIDELHRRDLLVVAWTVDDPDRAVELVRWAVDGITTHNVLALRERIHP